jgi:hypothetical protein
MASHIIRRSRVTGAGTKAVRDIDLEMGSFNV